MEASRDQVVALLTLIHQADFAFAKKHNMSFDSTHRYGRYVPMLKLDEYLIAISEAVNHSNLVEIKWELRSL